MKIASLSLLTCAICIALTATEARAQTTNIRAYNETQKVIKVSVVGDYRRIEMEIGQNSSVEVPLEKIWATFLLNGDPNYPRTFSLEASLCDDIKEPNRQPPAWALETSGYLPQGIALPRTYNLGNYEKKDAEKAADRINEFLKKHPSIIRNAYGELIDTENWRGEIKTWKKRLAHKTLLQEKACVNPIRLDGRRITLSPYYGRSYDPKLISYSIEEMADGRYRIRCTNGCALEMPNSGASSYASP